MPDTVTATVPSQESAGLFPPIADYGFLSNCEQSCLVAPDGSVEWLCLPRPDAPSVFGALLDRAAGLFRFGPGNTNVPQHRRYIPGTNVLETTWQTPTGWMTVRDLLVVDQLKHENRRADYHRAPADFGATGVLLRIATCVSGRVEIAVNCGPVFDYGTSGAKWTYQGDGYDTMTTASPDGKVRLALAGARSRLHSCGHSIESLARRGQKPVHFLFAAQKSPPLTSSNSTASTDLTMSVLTVGD